MNVNIDNSEDNNTQEVYFKGFWKIIEKPVVTREYPKKMIPYKQGPQLREFTEKDFPNLYITDFYDQQENLTKQFIDYKNSLITSHQEGLRLMQQMKNHVIGSKNKFSYRGRGFVFPIKYEDLLAIFDSGIEHYKNEIWLEQNTPKQTQDIKEKNESLKIVAFDEQIKIFIDHVETKLIEQKLLEQQANGCLTWKDELTHLASLLIVLHNKGFFKPNIKLDNSLNRKQIFKAFSERYSVNFKTQWEPKKATQTIYFWETSNILSIDFQTYISILSK